MANIAKICSHKDEAIVSGRLMNDILMCPDCLVCEIAKLKTEKTILKDKLEDWEDSVKAVIEEECKETDDRKHCSCVPILRAEVKRLQTILATIESLAFDSLYNLSKTKGSINEKPIG